MKFLKWLLYVVIFLLAVFFIGGALISPTFTVTRSVVIQAPPEKVYPLIANPRAWKQWSVWNQRDPGMAITYSGTESGAGAKWAWKSKSQGNGEMSFTAAEPNRRVAFELFFPDFGTTSRGDLSLQPSGAGTQVTWVMHGDMGGNIAFHWLALMSEKMVGVDFDAGLATLKRVAERPGTE